MLKLYTHELSGNCYKARLMLSLLGLEYEAVPINVVENEQKPPQFLKLNPLGQVPVLIDGDTVIRDSQAILVYLARCYGGENWLPLDAESMSKVVQWLSTAANEIQNSLAAARLYFLLNAQVDLKLAQHRAKHVLQVMNEHLQERDWLELARPTIADIACFPYVGLAADGKIPLESYPHVLSWIDRLKKLPGYVGMPGL